MKPLLNTLAQLNSCSCKLSNPNRVGHDPSGAKLGGNPGPHMPMLPGHVSPNGVVAGECSWTVWTGDTDSLMPLANVSS